MQQVKAIAIQLIYSMYCRVIVCSTNFASHDYLQQLVPSRVDIPQPQLRSLETWDEKDQISEISHANKLGWQQLKGTTHIRRGMDVDGIALNRHISRLQGQGVKATSTRYSGYSKYRIHFKTLESDRKGGELDYGAGSPRAVCIRTCHGAPDSRFRCWSCGFIDF